MSAQPSIPKFLRRVLGIPDPETKRRYKEATKSFDAAREELATSIEETMTEEVKIDIPPAPGRPETVPPSG